MSVGAVRRDTTTAEFFEGTARGEFLLRHCPSCGAYSEPQALACRKCGSLALSWVPADGRASLISHAVIHRRPLGDEPTAQAWLVIAQFDEGPWWWSRLTDEVAATTPTLTAGQPLRVVFERSTADDEYVPLFTLA